jgi:opacity protein-like surface antigen
MKIESVNLNMTSHACGDSRLGNSSGMRRARSASPVRNRRTSPDITARRGTFNDGRGQSHADLAWQIIAGTDYYWTPKFRTYVEYHYLNYTSTQIDTKRSRDLGRHLVGAGLRWKRVKHAKKVVLMGVSLYFWQTTQPLLTATP